MKYPTTRFVFDRKNTATKRKSALIQVEILLQGRKKYITTGVKVYKDQWNDKSHVINCEDMLVANKRIDSIKTLIDDYIQEQIDRQVPFDWEAFNRFITNHTGACMTFLDYIGKRIDERTDISLSTKKNHKKLIVSLTEYGRIVGFEQLTKGNIADYYEWLLGREITKIGKDGKEYKTRMSVPTVWTYMKTLRTYIHDAILHEKIDRDPSVGIKVRKGDYDKIRWLTEEEVAKIEKAELSSGSLVRVRDLFIFCCYSGLAYADLMDFKPEKLEKDNENTYLYGKRIKTGQEYVVLVLPQVQRILDKYEYQLPKYSNQQFNNRLKDVAKESNIDKPISSHWGRHTAAMMFLNNGVRIETVAKILGHSSIRITEQVYASVLKKTVVEEMKVMVKTKGDCE